MYQQSIEMNHFKVLVYLLYIICISISYIYMHNILFLNYHY